MSFSRRGFLSGSAAAAAGFAGLRTLVHTATVNADDSAGDATTSPSDEIGYGELLADPKGVLALPRGFTYKIISEEGDEMHDGFLVPGAPDGMAALAGPYGLTVLLRNHELTPDDTGPFGEDRKLADKVHPSKIYDAGNGVTPNSGGTSTIVFDTQTGRIVRQFLSLVGTIRNCAGGPTPWKTWISCEESVLTAGEHEDFQTEKDHGYNFEVPISARMELADPIPLIEMGRFNHEAVGVDPKTGIVYQTEDRDDGLFYRFLPKRPGELRAGGKLQALVISDKKSMDTRNWSDDDHFDVGESLAVEWLDVDDVTAPDDDLRLQGFFGGAARFARGEGIWYGNGEFFFACTSGGSEKIGQIWRYRPSYDEGTSRESQTPGKLELFIEPNDTNLVHNADNLTVTPWGDLIVAEDRDGQVVRLVGVTPQGQCYTFAMNHMRTEFAGPTFSPDGTTLFVNVQGAGLTLAITGPWRSQST